MNMKLKTIFGGKKLIYFAILLFLIIIHLIFGLLPNALFFIFVCILLTTLLLWFLNEFFKTKLNNIFIDFPGRINSYKNFKRNYDLACIGGTQGLYAIDLNNQNEISGLNWCLENQSFEYNLLMLKNFFSILKKDGKILLFLTPFDSAIKERGVKRNYKYQIFLDKFLFTVNKNKTTYFRDWLITNTLLRKKKDNLFLMSINYYPVLYPFTVIKLLLEVKKRKVNFKKTVALNNNEIEKEANRHVNEFIKYNSNITTEKNRLLLMQINKFIEARDLKLIIVIPPVSLILHNILAIKELSSEITIFINSAGISDDNVLNYMKNDKLTDNRLFFNSYCLNTYGRKQFSDIMINDIKQISQTI